MSDQRPNAGWTIEEANVATRTTAAASVYERSSFGVRKTRSAGDEPWARSAARWPADRLVIARRSTPTLTDAGYRRSWAWTRRPGSSGGSARSARAKDPTERARWPGGFARASARSAAAARSSSRSRSSSLRLLWRSSTAGGRLLAHRQAVRVTCPPDTMRREPIQITHVDTPPEAVEADVLAAPGQRAGAAVARRRRVDALAGRSPRPPDRRRRAEGASVASVARPHARRARGAPRRGGGRRQGRGRSTPMRSEPRPRASRLVQPASAAARSPGCSTTAIALDPAEQARAIVDGTVLGYVRPGRLEDAGERPGALTGTSSSAGPRGRAGRGGRDRAGVVAEWTNRCRELVERPANELTPTRARRAADDIAEAAAISRCEILGPQEIVGGRHGGVRRGRAGLATTEPRLIVLDYDPPGAATTSCSASSGRRSRSTPAASRSSRPAGWTR